MIIIIVNRNVATLVYDGNAEAISPTNFDSNCFSMDYVKDAENLRNQETGEMEITPAKLAGRTKYTLYKEGDMGSVEIYCG